MENFFLVVSLILTLLVLFCLFRGIYGPTVLDRIIGMNVVGAKTVVILVLVGFIYGRVEMFIDISLVYALLNFIGTLAAAKYFHAEGVD